MAVQKNWEVDQGTTFTFTVEYKDNNDDPIDLTGATAKLQVRDTQGGSKLAFTLTSPASGIIIDPLLGDRKRTRLNSSHIPLSRMPSSA